MHSCQLPYTISTRISDRLYPYIFYLSCSLSSYTEQKAQLFPQGKIAIGHRDFVLLALASRTQQKSLFGRRHCQIVVISWSPGPPLQYSFQLKEERFFSFGCPWITNEPDPTPTIPNRSLDETVTSLKEQMLHIGSGVINNKNSSNTSM